MRRAERVRRTFPEPDGRGGVEDDGRKCSGGEWRDEGSMDGERRGDIDLGVGHGRVRGEKVFVWGHYVQHAHISLPA